MDLPRVFTIRESSHRIHNPFSAEKLAILGRALHLAPGSRVLDLACGSGDCALNCAPSRSGMPATSVSILGGGFSR